MEALFQAGFLREQSFLLRCRIAGWICDQQQALPPAGIQSILAASMEFLGLRHYGNAITNFHLFQLYELLTGPLHYRQLSKSLLLQASLFLPLSDENCKSFKAAMSPSPFLTEFLTSDSVLLIPLAPYTITYLLLLCSAQIHHPEKYLITAGISYSQ